MRVGFALLASAATILFVPLPATAQPVQVIAASQVVAGCPDLRSATACVPLSSQFIAAGASGPRSNEEIVQLVVAIAESAQQPRTPRRSCLNAAEGIRVLATGSSDPAQASQINDIADALCENTSTAAIGSPAAGANGSAGSLNQVFESLVGSEPSGVTPVVVVADNSGDGGVVEPPPPPPPPPTGGLGHEGNGVGSPTALENASQVATSDPGGPPSTPPGQPSTPPGQPSTPPGQPSTPPGQPSTPPGQPSTPPGQARTP